MTRVLLAVLLVAGPATPALAADPSLLLSAEWLAGRLGKGKRARRAGHIPGAVNIEWRENLRPDGTFKSADELSSWAEWGNRDDLPVEVRAVESPGAR